MSCLEGLGNSGKGCYLLSIIINSLIRVWLDYHIELMASIFVSLSSVHPKQVYT